MLDSIIYSAKPGDYEPKLGDHLGDLNDGSHIVEIVCGGPKNYANITDAGVSKRLVYKYFIIIFLFFNLYLEKNII
jgi:hypothetical protein